MIELTFVLIKPDGVMKGVVEDIIQRYLDASLRILQRLPVVMDIDTAREFYSEHKDRFFFEGLILSMISGPCVALILEGENAVKVVRALNGATNPAEAEPGTIRHDFRSAGGPFNTVHGSDSRAAALREIDIVFKGNY